MSDLPLTETDLLQSMCDVREAWKVASGTPEQRQARCQEWVDGLSDRYVYGVPVTENGIVLEPSDKSAKDADARAIERGDVRVLK